MIDGGSIGALVRELALQAAVRRDRRRRDADGLAPAGRARDAARGVAFATSCRQRSPRPLGRPVRVETEAGIAVDSPALREAAERARRLAEAEQTIENDPLVRALMSQYKTARIVPGSVKSL